MEEIRILGIKVHSAEMWELHAEITRLIDQGGPSFILGANVHAINTARRVPVMAELYEMADLVWIEGAGVVLGGRMLGYAMHGRLATADWAWPFSRYCAEKGHTMFLLGGPEGYAQEAAERLTAHAPGLGVVGAHHGFFKKEGPENEAVIEIINKAAPDILWVGLGMPLQEIWISNNYKKIKAKTFWNIGGAFGVLIGKTKLSPRWMGDLGLEWLYRYLVEPRRLAGRYLWGNPVFIINILRQRFGLLKN